MKLNWSFETYNLAYEMKREAGKNVIYKIQIQTATERESLCMQGWNTPKDILDIFFKKLKPSTRETHFIVGIKGRWMQDNIFISSRRGAYSEQSLGRPTLNSLLC